MGVWAVAVMFAIAMSAPGWAQSADAARSNETSLAPYALALAVMASWAILMTVLLFLSVAGTPKAKTESGHPVRDYSDPAYRRNRAFQNAIETTGPFLAAILAAILVGASPFWTNLLALIFLVARMAMAAVHIGTEIQPLRSALWGIGLLCIIGLALMALFGAFAL
ncbi:MAG: MAPEG family protein [Pseudomonadota bacterium]